MNVIKKFFLIRIKSFFLAKKRMYRRGSATKDDRGRSPAGQIKSHPVLEEQDVGYTNAHM